jgi:dihydroorotase
MLNRRQFSKSVLGAGLGLLGSRKLSAGEIPAGFPSPPAQRSDEKFDLLIKGGTVIDPGRQLHAPMDVAVLNGKIQEMSEDIAESRSLRVVSAKGKIVSPGLIDIHQHCYDGVADCVNADHFCLAKGVTTVVDGGSAGYPAIANFRKYVINTSVTRIKALVNISPFGAVGPGGNVDVLKAVDPDLAAKAAEDNKPVVVGIKVRLGAEIQGADDIEFLKRGVQAAQATGLPLMAHIDGPYSPLAELLPMLRKGDIYTHFLHAHQHGSLDANGKLLPVVLEARQRGVLFDVAQGRSHLSWDVAEKCLQQGFLPDTLSTDLTRVTASDRVFDLPTMVSKFMALGVNMDKAIQMVTTNAARIFDFGAQLGTLKPRGEADISIFEVREGNFEFEDSDGKKRSGRQKLVSTAVVRHGELLVNQT